MFCVISFVFGCYFNQSLEVLKTEGDVVSAGSQEPVNAPVCDLPIRVICSACRLSTESASSSHYQYCLFQHLSDEPNFLLAQQSLHLMTMENADRCPELQLYVLSQYLPQSLTESEKGPTSLKYRKECPSFLP